MTDADYANDLVLLANTPAQAESLLHSLEQAGGGIGLHMNANKAEFICFKQKRAIATESGKHVKLVDQFIYLCSNISSAITIIHVKNSSIITKLFRQSNFSISIFIIKIN